MPSKLPRSKRLSIPGPVGAIEALVETPEDLASNRFGVVCHPHPLHGGTMHNKVTHTLARTMHDLGIPTIRFNFRGVGASAGEFDEGAGELEDVLAVAAWGHERWPDSRLCLAGFSFGGFIAIRAASRVATERLVTAAPAVTRMDARSEQLPDCPWLIVQGDADEVIEPRAVFDWVAAVHGRKRPAAPSIHGAEGMTSAPPVLGQEQPEAHSARARQPTLEVLPGVGHFFHGQLPQLRDIVMRFMRGS